MQKASLYAERLNFIGWAIGWILNTAALEKNVEMVAQRLAEIYAHGFQGTPA